MADDSGVEPDHRRSIPLDYQFGDNSLGQAYGATTRSFGFGADLVYPFLTDYYCAGENLPQFGLASSIPSHRRRERASPNRTPANSMEQGCTLQSSAIWSSTGIVYLRCFAAFILGSHHADSGIRAGLSH